MKRFFALLLILGLAGAGYWLYETKYKFLLQPAPVEVAPQRWQIGKSGNSSANSMPVAAMNDTNVNATNATEGTNATIVQAMPSDSVITHDFVRDVAEYFVARYHPAQTSKNPSAMARLDFNIKSMNIRYAMELPGILLDKGDTLKARKILFGHVLTPQVLEFLQTYYVPLFLDNLDRILSEETFTVADSKIMPMGETQRHEMLTLLATRFRSLGQTIAALARSTDIAPLIAKYLDDVEKVNDAHMAFWTLQNSNATELEIDDAGAKIKTTIQSREMSRQRLLQTLVTKIGPQGLDASELIYLAQWVQRRSMQNPASLPLLGKAGDLLVKTAGALEERARIPLAEALANATNSTPQPLQ